MGPSCHLSTERKTDAGYCSTCTAEQKSYSYEHGRSLRVLLNKAGLCALESVLCVQHSSSFLTSESCHNLANVAIPS